MNAPLTSALLATFLLGCSGGSGGTGSQTIPDDTQSLLVLDPEADSDTTLRAQLRAVVLERVDGSTTANLIAGPTPITIADPDGGPTSLTLRRVPPGVYVALDIALLEDSVEASRNGQPIDIAPSSLLQRIEFDRAMSTLNGAGRAALPAQTDVALGNGRRRGQGTALTLTHARSLDIVDGVWTPHWQARFGSRAFVRVRVEITSINLDANRAEAIIDRLGDDVFELDFSNNPSLLSNVDVGDSLRVTGVLTDARSLRVLRRNFGQGNGGMGRVVTGEITAIATDGGELTVSVEAGGTVTVRLDANTVYYGIVDDEREPIVFGDLTIGNSVEIFARRHGNPHLPDLAQIVLVN